MNWTLTEKELLKKFKTSISGLTTKEAGDRLKKYGLNVIPKKKKDSIFKLIFNELKDPIILLLIVTVIFSFLINEIIDAIAIIFIILVDLVLGTIQEWKAEKTAESLEKLIKDKVRAIRDNKEIEIDSSNLVIGDIVLLESGDQVSADLRLIEHHNLQIDESVLTGESISITKTSEVLNENLELSERKNMAFAGSNVTTGRGVGIVVSTGIDTEIGKIADKVTNSKDEASPLAIRMNKFSNQISVLIIIIGIIISIILYLKNVPGTEIFLSVIAISVSAMPEGLPLALTMALTIASNKMAKKV